MVMYSEINKLALELTGSKHPTSVSVGNFNDDIWKHIDPSQLSVTPRILTGGPSCKPFSASGKKEGGKNPLASQLCDTADMAHHLAVDAVLLENVDLLLTEDHIHGQMSLCVDYFKSKGFYLVNTDQRQNSAFGGFTSRKRVLLWFESARLTELLPPHIHPASWGSLLGRGRHASQATGLAGLSRWVLGTMPSHHIWCIKSLLRFLPNNRLVWPIPCDTWPAYP